MHLREWFKTLDHSIITNCYPLARPISYIHVTGSLVLYIKVYLILPLQGNSRREIIASVAQSLEHQALI